MMLRWCHDDIAPLYTCVVRTIRLSGSLPYQIYFFGPSSLPSAPCHSIPDSYRKTTTSPRQGQQGLPLPVTPSQRRTYKAPAVWSLCRSLGSHDALLGLHILINRTSTRFAESCTNDDDCGDGLFCCPDGTCVNDLELCGEDCKNFPALIAWDKDTRNFPRQTPVHGYGKAGRWGMTLSAAQLVSGTALIMRFAVDISPSPF